ncbi:MAG: putative sulfate/molybdate transporter [Planctomycetota bacterium]
MADLAPADHAAPLAFVLQEAAGSLGDLGTFIPIVVGMTQIVGLDPATVLVFAGLANVLTGLFFRIPIAVQPMKAIAALAIVGAMSRAQVGVAGFAVGVGLLLMGVLGLIDWLARAVPRPVVRGLQAAVGLQLLLGGLRLGLYAPGAAALRPLWGPEGLLMATGAVLLALLLARRRRWLPFALVALALLGAACKEPGLLHRAPLSLWRPTLVVPDSGALAGIWLGAVPQVPLTLLNSVLAVSLLAGSLFAERGRRASPTRLAVSVGLMNVLTCPFGGMPLCHGSGGLAGQYRFGARTGLSMVILGTAKLMVGLAFGAVALAWMRAFPSAVLGVFLALAGLTLVQAGRCWHSRRSLTVAAVMVAVHLASGLLVAGFAAGWIACAIWPAGESRPKGAAEEGACPADVRT